MELDVLSLRDAEEKEESLSILKESDIWRDMPPLLRIWPHVTLSLALQLWKSAKVREKVELIPDFKITVRIFLKLQKVIILL